MEDKPKPKRNKRLLSKGKHVGGALIERETSILDGDELDKRGLSLRDY